MKKMVLSFVSLLLATAFLLNLTGCGNSIKAQNLMKNITAQKVNLTDDLSGGNAKMTDFAVRLFKECEISGENTLISPLSVMYALAMTANGADGNTLAEMESVLGLSIMDLNRYLYSYRNSLSKDEDNKINLANFIWFSKADDFKVNQDFLQTNANYYGADIYKADFDKKSTLNDINQWISNKTDKMIPKMVEQIEKDDVMFLVNALTFDADWSTKYTDSKIKSGVFTREDATEQNVKFMYSTQSIYLEDETTKGFLKHYENTYAFVALLPNKNITVSEYVNSLSNEKIINLLANKQNTVVNAAIPKFECKFELMMNDTLKQMGMPLAFDKDKANLSKLGHANGANLYISEVLHKTFISVNEDGTKAGAATEVRVKKKAGVVNLDKEIKTVYLDRPFVYMIIDCKNNVPIFMGTVMSIEN